MSIVVYQDVATPIVPIEGLAGRVREALGDALRSMRYVTPDFAGLYQDAAGTTPVTEVGQPVGLMLDRRFGLERGPELLVNNDFSDGTNGWVIAGESESNYVVTGGGGIRYVMEQNIGVLQVFRENVMEVGRTYALTVNQTSVVAGQLQFATTVAVAPIPAIVGSHEIVYTTPHPRFAFRRQVAPTDITVASVSCREVPGNHARQATTTARPTLRSGPLRIDYDGVDDYLRTAFPALGSNVTIARSIPGVGAQILTGQTIAAGDWDDNVTSCATLVIDRALTGPETALVTAFLNQQAGV